MGIIYLFFLNKYLIGGGFSKASDARVKWEASYHLFNRL